MQAERELKLARADVERFAVASGDRNPLHVDSEFAAATAFGAPIAHGSLIAIAMLGALPDDALTQVRSLHISFAGAVFPDTTATVLARASEREPESWEIRLTARGKTVARVLARAHAERAMAAAPSQLSGRASQQPGDAPRRPVGSPRAMRVTPAEPGAEEMAAGHALAVEYATGAELHALALRLHAGALDPRLLEGLAWASYVVGMELPGLHSLLAGLALEVDEQRPPDGDDGGSDGGGRERHGGHMLRVLAHDERTGQITIEGALAKREGTGRALARIQCFALPNAPPPDPAALGLDRPAEHDRGAVVVAGGSRGFGASIALALLALGYEVHVAYANSPACAAQLARLAGSHRRRLHLTRMDIGDPDAVRSLADTVTGQGHPLAGLVLNAAPPPLAMSLTPQSAAELADYVAASLRLVSVPLASLLGSIDEHGWVMFCSSSALAAPPRDWPHYVSAKAAVEGLASWVAATRPSLHTVVVRPPKMQTAMTGTPSGRMGATSADAVALWAAGRLADGELEPGLTTLEPSPREETRT